MSGETDGRSVEPRVYRQRVLKAVSMFQQNAGKKRRLRKKHHGGGAFWQRKKSQTS